MGRFDPTSMEMSWKVHSTTRMKDLENGEEVEAGAGRGMLEEAAVKALCEAVEDGVAEEAVAADGAGEGADDDNGDM